MKRGRKVLKRGIVIVMAFILALNSFGVPEPFGGIFPVEVSARASGEDSTAFGYQYNKKTKRIHGVWGGSGNMEDWYLTTNRSGKLKRVYLSLIEVNANNGNPIYRASYAGREISKKAYFKKKREWNRNYRQLKMQKKSGKNIQKYIR